MKRLFWIIPLVFLTACPKDKNARDVAAALSGVLVTAQDQYAPICVPSPTQTACVAIKKGIAAQNALITATETYCGMALSPIPPPTNTKCVPVKSAESALITAIANANQAVTEVKALIH